MCKCKICGKECKNVNGIAKHLNIHNIELLKYYVKYEDFEIPKCIICGKDAKLNKGLKFRRTCSDISCGNKTHKIIHSTETKILLSEKRKKYLKLNPDKHPWKQKDKQLSVPCELFKTKLKNNNINYIEEYSPLEDRFFSIDIAFPDKKIGIEINGNQHYETNGKLKKYYQERKNIIEKGGWKLYDIYYTKVYDDDFCNIVINNLKNNNLGLINYEFIKYTKNTNKCVDCSCDISNGAKRCKKCNILNRIKNRPNIEQLKLDIIELGYCGTGRKYNVSDNAIRKWINSPVA